MHKLRLLFPVATDIFKEGGDAKNEIISSEVVVWVTDMQISP